MADSNQDSKGRFKPGNNARAGKPPSGGRKPLDFKEHARRLVEGDPEMYMGMEGKGVLKVLRDIVAYPGNTVKMSDRIAACKLLIEYAYGKPTEHVVNENLNRNMEAYSKEQLIQMAEEEARKLKENDANESGRAEQAGGNPGGAGEEKRAE